MFSLHSNWQWGMWQRWKRIYTIQFWIWSYHSGWGSTKGCCAPSSGYFGAFWKVNLSKRFQCEGNKSNFCQYNKCKCQEELAYQFSTLLTEFDESHVTYRDGGFDVATCRTNNGAASGSGSSTGSESSSQSNSKEIVCCGNYPNRFPFNTQDGNRACCEADDETGVTYNSNLYECCAGSLSSIGSCTI